MSTFAKPNSGSEIKLALLCILAGIGAGLGAVVFRYSIELFHKIMRVHFAGFLSGLSQWAIIFIPIIGMCVVWLFLRATLRKGEGHGVEEVMRSISLNEGRIPGKIVPIECVASSFCMGFGGSVGPEGPMIQIGSGVGSFIGQVFNLEQRKLVLITAAGAAGGLGAIFNAPIAGVIFAMEAVLEEFNTKGFCYLVLSSVVATQITKSILGNRVLLEMEGAVWGQWPELIIFAIMGIIGGLVGVSFVLLLNKTSSFVSSINFVPAYVKPICGGIILGLFALYFPVVLGEGYEYIDMAMDLRFTMGMFFLIVLLKILATVVTLSSGGSGGVFAPSLVIGSMFGGGFFWVASTFCPGIVGSPETYIAVGVATILGSAFKSPMTAIIMVMEITNNYAIVLPVMVASVCATFIGWALLRGCSIYNISLIQEGIREVETDFWVPRTRSAYNYQKISQ